MNLTNQMDSSTPCKVQHMYPLPEGGGVYAAVPGTIVVPLDGVFQVVAEPIRREAVTVVRPDDPGHNGMDYAL